MKKNQKFRSLHRILLFALTIAFLSGCTHTKPLKIAISKATRNYLQWVTLADSSAETVDLYSMSIDSALRALDDCSALLLTGGEDIYPGIYGNEADTGKCTGFDRHRDSAEIKFLERALLLKMPVFGICRGNQLINVALKGTLIRDIPTQVDSAGIHQCEDYLNCFHLVLIRKGSLLRNISKCDSALVTTNHHQAVERLSPLLQVNARSTDGLTEGIEWLDPGSKPFLLGVQWHPERMDRSNPLSGKLADEFIRQARLFRQKSN